MKKEQIKHFVLNKTDYGNGIPACNCFSDGEIGSLYVFDEEVAKTRRQVTCKNCRRTRVFRKLK